MYVILYMYCKLKLDRDKYSKLESQIAKSVQAILNECLPCYSAILYRKPTKDFNDAKSKGDNYRNNSTLCSSKLLIQIWGLPMSYQGQALQH